MPTSHTIPKNATGIQRINQRTTNVQRGAGVMPSLARTNTM